MASVSLTIAVVGLTIPYVSVYALRDAAPASQRARA